MSSTFSVGSAASALGLSAPECAPSPSASQNHSAAQCSPGTGPMSTATTTCVPSPQLDWLLTESASMSSAEGFPAKTSASQGVGQDSLESAAASGLSSTALSRKSSRATRSLKTSLPFALEDWTLYSGASLRSGMTRNGIVYALPALDSRTAVIASGLLYTPAAQGWKAWTFRNPYALIRKNHVDGNLQEHLMRRFRLMITPELEEILMGFPQSWTDLKPSEMPSSRKSQKSSAKQ